MPIEEVVAKCHRGDWLLWLAKKVDIDLRPLTLAKARCAKTVIHLMKDERSINAVNIAERFGLGECSREELAAAAYADADSKIKNQLETANICREILGESIINKVNKLLNETTR
jgi:hypothetical protein